MVLMLIRDYVDIDDNFNVSVNNGDHGNIL